MCSKSIVLFLFFAMFLQGTQPCVKKEQPLKLPPFQRHEFTSAVNDSVFPEFPLAEFESLHFKYKFQGGSDLEYSQSQFVFLVVNERTINCVTAKDAASEVIVIKANDPFNALTMSGFFRFFQLFNINSSKDEINIQLQFNRNSDKRTLKGYFFPRGILSKINRATFLYDVLQFDQDLDHGAIKIFQHFLEISFQKEVEKEFEEPLYERVWLKSTLARVLLGSLVLVIMFVVLVLIFKKMGKCIQTQLRDKNQAPEIEFQDKLGSVVVVVNEDQIQGAKDKALDGFL